MEQVPETLAYTREHEWVRLSGATATVGITDHAQAALGDITFVELPAPGKALAAHDVLAVIESVKAASDVFAPLAGTVEAVNDALAGAPEAINRDPYGEGWICRLGGVAPEAAKGLLTAEQYRAFCAEA